MEGDIFTYSTFTLHTLRAWSVFQRKVFILYVQLLQNRNPGNFKEYPVEKKRGKIKNLKQMYYTIFVCVTHTPFSPKLI
jgi:hypothetical protein